MKKLALLLLLSLPAVAQSGPSYDGATAEIGLVSVTGSAPYIPYATTGTSGQAYSGATTRLMLGYNASAPDPNFPYYVCGTANPCTGGGPSGSFTLTTTGTSGAATYSGGVLNIPIYGSSLTPNLTGVATDGSGNAVQITALPVADVTGAAPLASPTFTGTPLAPTPTPGDSSTKLATTAFLTTALTGVNTFIWNGDCLGYFTFQDTSGNAMVDQCNTANFGSLSGSVPPTRTGNGYQFAYQQQADFPASVNNWGTMTMVVELPIYAFGNNTANQYTPSTILLGTHSSTNNVGFDLLGQAQPLNVGQYGIDYFGYSSGSFSAATTNDIFTGTVVLTVVCPTGRGPQVYLGTTLIQNDAVVAHSCGQANPLPNGNYQLGTSSNTVTAATANLALIGKIDLVRFSATSTMTTAQIAANVALATQIVAQRGIALTGPPYVYTTAQYIATGDSITCAFGIVSSPACGYLTTGLDSYAGTTLLTAGMLNNAYGRQINGASGAFIQQQIANIPWVYGPQSKSASGASIASLFEGTNNFGSTTSAATVWNLAVAWNRIEQAYGPRTFYIDMIARTGNGSGAVPFNTSKNGLATLARTGWQTAGYKALDDMSADPLMGCDGCQTNGGTFNGSGSGTNITVSSIAGTITIGTPLTGTGIPACTTIVSQTSGPAGGNGVYVTSATTTASGSIIFGYFQTDGTHPTVCGQTRIAQSVACTINSLDGSSPTNINPTAITASTYTATCADGGLNFDTTSNNITVTENSALWQTGRQISRCNKTPAGTNTLTLTAPSDFPFDNITGKTTLNVLPGTCAPLTATFNGNTTTPGDFWSTVPVAPPTSIKAVVTLTNTATTSSTMTFPVGFYTANTTCSGFLPQSVTSTVANTIGAATPQVSSGGVFLTVATANASGTTITYAGTCSQ